jgi:hypothetical protein
LSHSLTNHDQITDSLFPAASFYAARDSPSLSTHVSINIDKNSEQFNDNNGDGTDVENEDEWFEVPAVTGLTQKTLGTSKASEAIALEVCL